MRCYQIIAAILLSFSIGVTSLESNTFFWSQKRGGGGESWMADWWIISNKFHKRRNKSTSIFFNLTLFLCIISASKDEEECTEQRENVQQRITLCGAKRASNCNRSRRVGAQRNVALPSVMCCCSLQLTCPTALVQHWCLSEGVGFGDLFWIIATAQSGCPLESYGLSPG